MACIVEFLRMQQFCSDLGIPADSFLDLAVSMTSPGQDEAALRFVLTVHTRAQRSLR